MLKPFSHKSYLELIALEVDLLDIYQSSTKLLELLCRLCLLPGAIK